MIPIRAPSGRLQVEDVQSLRNKLGMSKSKYGDSVMIVEDVLETVTRAVMCNFSVDHFLKILTIFFRTELV